MLGLAGMKSWSEIKDWDIIQQAKGMLTNTSMSGRVLDSRPRGRGFERHRRHCIVSLSKTH